MKVLSVPLSDLKEDPQNARKHGQRNIEAIKASLDRFGQQTPIVIDGDNVVRKGNGTFRAARELGWDKLQCVRTTLAGSEAKAYAIADNRTGDLAEWDELVLAETIKSLQSEEDEALSLATGFDDDEVDELLERLAEEHANDNQGPSVLGSTEGKTKATVYLTWEANRVPLTDQEIAKLNQRLEVYFAENGTSYGFLGSLLSE